MHAPMQQKEWRQRPESLLQSGVSRDLCSDHTCLAPASGPRCRCAFICCAIVPFGLKSCHKGHHI